MLSSPLGGATLATISTAHLNSTGDSLAPFALGFAALAWPAANLAMFVPFELYQPTTFSAIEWHNGNVVSGNVDAGVYDVNGTQLVHTGSTAQSGTSAPQSVSITPLTLAPGIYYLALALDNTTGTIVRQSPVAAVYCEAAGMKQQATAFPLPSPATLAAPTNNYFPLMGLLVGTVI